VRESHTQEGELVRALAKKKKKKKKIVNFFNKTPTQKKNKRNIRPIIPKLNSQPTLVISSQSLLANRT